MEKENICTIFTPDRNQISNCPRVVVAYVAELKSLYSRGSLTNTLGEHVIKMVIASDK